MSLNENKKTQNIMFENRFIQRNSDKLCYDDTKALTVGEYSAEFISKIMEQASNDEFFVTYNHPVWSMETQNEYCNYHGMNAMEILNYGCVTEGYDDRNGYIYDQILRGGEKIYCIATDDNHNKFSVGDPKFDSFGGFTMIKAEALEYSAIAEALKKGYFYSSEGPGIKELYFEDDKIYIETTDASRIVMTTANRKYRVVTAENVGEILNSACFDIQADYGDYIRFTVTDLNGKEAYTNAYYISELSLNRI